LQEPLRESSLFFREKEGVKLRPVPGKGKHWNIPIFNEEKTPPMREGVKVTLWKMSSIFYQKRIKGKGVRGRKELVGKKFPLSTKKPSRPSQNSGQKKNQGERPKAGEGGGRKLKRCGIQTWLLFFRF